jgi:hypothetical protein
MNITITNELMNILTTNTCNKTYLALQRTRFYSLVSRIAPYYKIFLYTRPAYKIIEIVFHRCKKVHADVSAFLIVR